MSDTDGLPVFFVMSARQVQYACMSVFASLGLDDKKNMQYINKKVNFPFKYGNI